MRAPLVPIAVSFAVGVWLGLSVGPPGWVPGIGVGLGALALIAARRNHLPAASAAVVLLCALAGWGRLGLADPLPATVGLQPGPASLEGIVSGDPETEGPRTRLPFLLQGVVTEHGLAPASGSLLVHLYGPAPPPSPGAHIRVAAQVTVPQPFRNPGGSDLELWAPRRQPRYLVLARADAVERLPDGATPWWLRVRFWIHRIVQAELPPVSGALFEGLLIGERRHLPPTLLADFRAAGVFHILAISGFNVGLIVGAVFLLLRLLRAPPRGAAALTLATLGAFVAVVGAQASVLRATVMGSLILAAQLLGRESSVWNSLAAALAVLLLLEPGSLADPGLQLSFAATAGILHLGPPLRHRLEARWPRPFAEAVAVSLAAQLAVTPLMVAHWSQLSLIGVLANLMVVPLAAALTTLGFVALLLAGVSAAVAHLVFHTLWILLLALRLVVRAFAAVPGAILYVPSPPTLSLVAASAALVFGPLAASSRGRAAVAALVGVAVGFTAIGYLPDGRLHVLVLDVGQGDAILVRGPDGRALLVDTGGGGLGRSDRGERVVLPVLRRAGVRRLAALAVTHGDPDHAGGLVSLLTGIPIDEVWVPAGTEDADWQRPLAEAGTRRRVLARGDRIWLGPVLVTVLHPARGPTAPFDTNNASLVLRVEWGLVAALLTGDAEARAEREILAAGLPVNATLLKVGHHGSRHGSSAEFVSAVDPRFAVVSAGRRNAFGHPSPPTLARLEAVGASIYRTDLDGAVELTTDGERAWIRRWARPGATEEVRLAAAP